MNNRTRLSRLKKLHYILMNHDTIFPKVEFDISTWCVHRSCGTAACALGSAGLYQPFRELGLKASDFHVSYNDKYGYHSGMGAGEAFFGITWDESVKLFDPSSYRNHLVDDITAHTVATRVQRLIKKYLKPKKKGK